MVNIYNNKILVSKDQPEYNSLKEMLVIIERTKDEDIIHNLYKFDDEENLIIYPGLIQFIPEHIERKYYISEPSITKQLLAEFELKSVAKLSDEVILRNDQLIAINKMIHLKNGFLQLPTGIGKTEIISGFLLSINRILDRDLPTVILEPTIKLVEDTVARFRGYGINASEYSRSRGKNIEGIVVTHPKSLVNDLKKNPDLLGNLKVVIADEAQHLQCDTWQAIISAIPEIEFRLGLSALVIDPDKLPVTNINRLDYTEATVLGCTGRVLMEMKPSFYIERGILATPILFRLVNAADEYIKKDNNWTLIRKYRLESLSRSIKVAEISSFLANLNYKNLILVGTKNHAYTIMEQINRFGLGDLCRCSFGGNSYYRWDNESKSAVPCSKDEDTFSKFESGEFKILIGTSHIYEGADVPNLDSVILASIGKKPRRVIQGIGRALRKTKKSKHGYAYIFDFTDHYDYVLNKHSCERLAIYKNLIGVTDDHIYSGISFSTFKKIFYDLENNNLKGVI